jgi:deoxyadenosine/deoxycytidine kinase
MPKSKLRGGAKAHKARVAKRNERLKVERKQAQKQYLQLMEQRLQEFQNKFSGMTENDELNAENVVDVLTSETTQEEVKPTEDEVSELEK